MRQYLFLWQLPVIAVFAIGWLAGGAYLLKRSASHLQTRRKLTFGRSVLAMFLGGLGASVSGGAVFMLMRRLSLRTEANLAIPTGLLVGVAMLLGLFVVLYAFLNTGAKQALLAVLPTLLLIVVMTAALGVPSVLIAYDRGQRRLNCDLWARRNVQLISRAINQYSNSDPPDTLTRLVETKAIKPETLRCPNAPQRDVGLFYMPLRTRSHDDKQYENKLRACDYRDNHRGLNERAVIFVTGRVALLSEAEFQELLRRPENAEFAKALAQVEGK